jgi:hypothetical protein
MNIEFPPTLVVDELSQNSQLSEMLPKMAH